MIRINDTIFIQPISKSTRRDVGHDKIPAEVVNIGHDGTIIYLKYKHRSGVMVFEHIKLNDDPHFKILDKTESETEECYI